MNISAFVILFILGIVICVIGGMNCAGNISTLHSYHRQRVSEENVKPFGKMIGIGTLIIGIAMLVYAVLVLVSTLTNNHICTAAGVALLVVSIIVGAAISFKAMIKYNGGIF